MLGLMPPQGMKPPPIGRSRDLDARRKKRRGDEGRDRVRRGGGLLIL